MAKISDDLLFVRRLGQGANTHVVLMRSATSTDQFCRKTVQASAPNWESQVRQLRNEFEVGQHNTHPVLRQSMEFGIVRRRFRAVEAYVLLRYIEGQSLSDWAITASVADIVRTFHSVADGLADLHRRGFVHADLKPHNILCGPTGQPTLIDFGQSCPIWHTKERIQGTADFIAPEQVDREPLDARTDVFCLGATMHLVFFGRPAQTELNTSSMRKGGRITLERRTVSVEGREETLDPPLVKLIEDCLQPERAKRPDSMARVMDRLDICLGRLSKSA